MTIGSASLDGLDGLQQTIEVGVGWLGLMVPCFVAATQALLKWQFLLANGKADGYFARGVDVDGYGDVDGSAGSKLWLVRQGSQCGRS